MKLELGFDDIWTSIYLTTYTVIVAITSRKIKQKSQIGYVRLIFNSTSYLKDLELLLRLFIESETENTYRLSLYN